MGVSSYGAGTESGELVFTKELRLDVRGRDVLLIDDILDTGREARRRLAPTMHGRRLQNQGGGQTGHCGATVHFNRAPGSTRARRTQHEQLDRVHLYN